MRCIAKRGGGIICNDAASSFLLFNCAERRCLGLWQRSTKVGQSLATVQNDRQRTWLGALPGSERQPLRTLRSERAWETERETAAEPKTRFCCYSDRSQQPRMDVQEVLWSAAGGKQCVCRLSFPPPPTTRIDPLQRLCALAPYCRVIDLTTPLVYPLETFPWPWLQDKFSY